MDSQTLALLFEIGPVISQSGMDEIIEAVPADGSPSLQTGEKFTCRMWAKNTLVALHNEGLVRLRVDIGKLMNVFHSHR